MRQSNMRCQRTFCTIENTTESRSAISNTFHKDVEKQNPYQSKSRPRRPDLTLSVVFFSGVQYVISVRDSEGNMLSAHASTIYEM
jgi:hypothetical protein